MPWTNSFIAVDWGTTNRRAWRIVGDAVAAEFEDDRGVLTVDDFPAAVSEIHQRLGELPLLMAGMIGSNRGWVEAPYVPCPAGLDAVAANLRWVAAGEIAIVPGLSFESADHADVMRGEEVQLLGAIAGGLLPPDAVLCHPGTHNKWATIAGGEVVQFRTVMTGEMFHLLKAHSVLSDMLQAPVTPGEAFDAGVRQGLHGDALTATLFSIRARVLLGGDRDGAASYASGLLIGADIASNWPGQGDLFIIGRPELTGLYAAALAVAGGTARCIDGEAAFLHGIIAIADRITP